MEAPSNAPAGLSAACGERLLPTIVDERAHTEPNRPMVIVPVSPKSYKDGAKTITYAAFARAVNRYAWFLEETLGKPADTEVLPYLGPNDLRYYVGVLGAMKVGYALLLTSPRNSISNHLHLIEKNHCKTFLKDKNSHIEEIISAYTEPLHSIDIPDLDYFFAEGEAKPYNWTPAYADVKDKVCLVLHSSGSTGQVKPIKLTHASASSIDRHHLLKSSLDFQPFLQYTAGDGKNTMFFPMPFFHSAGIFTGLMMNIFFTVTMIAAPPNVPLATPMALETLEVTKPDFAVFPPSMLEEMTEDPQALKALEKPQAIMYAGGPLSDYAADVISKHTRLQSLIGTTEAGVYPLYVTSDPANDYPYIRIDPEDPSLDFRQHEGNIYDLVLTRGNGVQWSSIFDSFPDKHEYDTSDLWQKHPTKPGLWKHSGRSDDVILLSNGEKVVPATSESILHQAPILHDVILYGQKRFQIAAIIELEQDAQKLSRGEALKQLDPYIKELNSKVPGHARLSPDYILFTTAEKPLSRAPKGTVARNASYKAFELELDALYGQQDSVQTSEHPLVKGVDETATTKELIKLFERVTDVKNLGLEQDFLDAGVDSLNIITLVRHIKAQLEAEQADVPIKKVNTSLIYGNPSPSKLAHALHNLDTVVSNKDQMEEHLKGMDDMLKKYTANLLSAPSNPAPAHSDNLTVVLTGSTGSLGSYLLASLVRNSAVAKVYALNRSNDAHKAQVRALQARDLPTDLQGKVQFLHMDVGQPKLGLDEASYKEIQSTAHIILHNAWPVNFNIPLKSFELHVAGMRSVIDLATTAPTRPAVLFTSSVGTVTDWPALYPDQAIPESTIHDSRAPGAGAYGSSKWIAEQMLNQAAKQSGVRNVNVRVGQLCGSVTQKSVWSKWEWFPSIMISSAYLGKVPDTLGLMTGVDFVPLDVAAETLLELAYGAAKRTEPAPEVVYNMVNPTHVPYSPFVPTIVDCLSKSTEKTIEVVPFADWVQALKDSTKSISDADIEHNPGVKLADFYESLLPESAEAQQSAENAKGSNTEKIRAESETLRALTGVKSEWIEAWLAGWGF